MKNTSIEWFFLLALTLPLLFRILLYTYQYEEYSMGNRLLEKYQDVIKSIKESTGIKIVSVEEVEDNQAFLAVKEVI